jgi:hypothetical protein
MESMSNSTPSRYPVTVTHLPLVRCAVCRRTVAHQPGEASVVLTKHYEKAHPEMAGGDRHHRHTTPGRSRTCRCSTAASAPAR